LNISEAILALKQDMEVVDAIGIYNLSLKGLEYSDLSLGSLEFFYSMVTLGCFSEMEFLYHHTSDDTQYFMRKWDRSVLIIKIKSDIQFNKALFEITTKNFCKVHLV
jgi:hypothetical protein